jgi:WD40 repeat protein
VTKGETFAVGAMREKRVADDSEVIVAIAISEDERLVAAAGSFGTIYIWNMSSQVLVHKFVLAGRTNLSIEERVSVAFFGVDRVAVGHSDCGDPSGVVIWDLKSGQLASKLPIADFCGVSCLREASRSAGPYKIIVGCVPCLGLFAETAESTSGRIRTMKTLDMWADEDVTRFGTRDASAARGHERELFNHFGDVSRFQEGVHGIVVSPDGSRVIAVGGSGRDGVAAMFSLKDGTVIWQKAFQGFPLFAASAVNGFKEVAICAGPRLPVSIGDARRNADEIVPDANADTVKILNSESGAELDEWHTKHEIIISLVDCGVVGAMATLGFEGKIRLWGQRGHELLAAVSPELKQARAMVSSSSGKYLLAGGQDGVVQFIVTSKKK